MDIVATAKADATATAKRLDRLEKAEAKVAGEIESERDQVSRSASGSSTAASGSQSARSTKFALLRSSRDRRHELEDDVGELRRAGEDPGAARRLLRRPRHAPARSGPARAG